MLAMWIEGHLYKCTFPVIGSHLLVQGGEINPFGIDENAI
jgi:hypothetical protein